MFSIEDNFDKAIKVVLAHEGGYTNDPADPGGPTNFGISSKFIKENNLDINVKELTIEEAKKLYRDYFWDKYRLSLIPNCDIATKLFDTTVNIGPIPAIKLAQRVLMKIYEPMVLDGVIGHHTLEALGYISTEYFLKMYREYEAHYYHDLVITNPKLEPELAGWLHRAAS